MVRTVLELAVALVALVPSLTVQKVVWVPAAVNAGVPVIVAVRGEGPAACAVNVNDAGFPACVIVRLSAASASVAVAVIVAIAIPSDPDAVAGAEIAGAHVLTAIIVRVLVLAAAWVVPVPSLTVHTLALHDALPIVGVPVIVAVRGEGPAACAVNVNDAGFPACVIVRLSAASASVAVAVIVAIATPSDPDAVAGAEIAGCRFTFAIVSTVFVLAVALVVPVPSFTVHTMV